MIKLICTFPPYPPFGIGKRPEVFYFRKSQDVLNKEWCHCLGDEMEELRKLHNNCKRKLILDWVHPGSFVLDCGCGRGGDWWKWRAVRARVAAIDPDPESLKEAEDRALEMNFGVWFLGQGDIRHAAFVGPFDVVCYNFSLHYIFEDEKTFVESMRAIKVAVSPGGLLIGIVPEKARAESMVDEHGRFVDTLGNEFQMCGNKLKVRLADGPFYADGPKEEPLLDGSVLIQNLKNLGFDKLVWEPMLPSPNGLVSDVYTKFVFRNSRDVVLDRTGHRHVPGSGSRTF
jgi:ubiquinone/menaquinone biosynthesis C-methylase UbiE